MSIKLAKTVLTIFKDNKYENFFKNLVYEKIRFEVLNPTELGSEWSDVDFIQQKSLDQDELLARIDKILQAYQPKGIFNSFIDNRPVISYKDIYYINNHQDKAKFFGIISKLEEYNLYKDLTVELHTQRSDNNNVLDVSKKANLFTQEILSKFNSGHTDEELEDSSNQIKYFTDDLKQWQKNIVEDLKEFNFNPENISKDNYLLLCSIYASLELESILLNSTSQVFHLSSNQADKNTSYAFISVHPDNVIQFNKILEQHEISSEATNWSKDIVVWNQSDSITPFKNVAQSLGTISTKEFDPSFIISIFFSLFFAFCLGDAIYGLILAAFTGYFIFFKNLKQQFAGIFQLFFVAGVSTIIFGALFNSWAGDLFAKTSLNPILQNIQLIDPLNPLSEAPINQFLLAQDISPIVALLGFSVLIGLVNLLIGYSIKVINAYKAKNMKEFSEDLNWLLFVILGFTTMFNSFLPAPVGIVITALFAVSGLSFFVTNSGKGVVGKVMGGLAKFYNLIGFGSDLLSFTRLIAVGLTGGIIANVVNLLAFLIYDSIPIPVLNVVLTALILVVGHLFNLTISLFGAYINPLRLHYVEFLPKFYNPSGQKLNFVNTDFKYLKLKN